MLHRSKVRRAGERRVQRCRRESAEVEKSGEVEFEDCFWDAHESRVAAELVVVVAGDEVEIVRELVTCFGAHDR